MIDKLLAVNWLYRNQQYYSHPNGLGTARDTFFRMYNILTGESKRTTSCGRCVAGMRLKLQNLKKELDTMTQFDVYRTTKGTLTFVVQKDQQPIFLIRSSTKSGADEALKMLKDYEKRESKKIED